MSRRLELLGLAAAAVLVVTAVSAASASGFTAQSTPTWLSGAQMTQNVLTVNAGTVKCSVATFKSQAAISTLTTTTVAVRPEYGTCIAFGLEANVINSGCSYVLTAAGAFSVGCMTGAAIVVSVPEAGCQIKFSAAGNANRSSVSYASLGSGSTEEVVVTATVGGITYVSSGGTCGTAGSNGTYSGTLKLAGFESSSFANQHGFSVP